VKPMVTPSVGYIAGNCENRSERDDRQEAITKPIAGSEIQPCHDVDPRPKAAPNPREATPLMYPFWDLSSVA
jgi:hypothetical protein